MTLRAAHQAIVILFPASEVALALFKRSNAGTSRVDDRGSLRLLWIVIGASIGLAIAARWLPGARLPLSPEDLLVLSGLLLLAGMGIRWASILTLGRLFTVDVAVQEGHGVVERGPYRWVRHPSYAGLLLAFLGLGISYGSWYSLLALVVPISCAVAYRIVQEERVLLAALGAPYAAYCGRTKRLVPGIL